MWQSFYLVACNKYHMRPEPYSELLSRLGKDEDNFHKAQDTKVTARRYEERLVRDEVEKKRVEDEKRAEERKRNEAQRALDAARYGQYGGS